MAMSKSLLSSLLFTIWIGLSVALSACGQKGALVIPDAQGNDRGDIQGRVQIDAQADEKKAKQPDHP